MQTIDKVINDCALRLWHFVPDLTGTSLTVIGVDTGIRFALLIELIIFVNFLTQTELISLNPREQ